jgi:hypothetical protein
MLVLPLAVYTSIGLFFIVQTYVEGTKSKEGGPVLRVVGLLLCLVWPVILLGVLIEVLRARFRFDSAEAPSPHLPLAGQLPVGPKSRSAHDTARRPGGSTNDPPPTQVQLQMAQGASARKSGQADLSRNELQPIRQRPDVAK